MFMQGAFDGAFSQVKLIVCRLQERSVALKSPQPAIQTFSLFPLQIRPFWILP